MQYKKENVELLKELTDLLKRFPFQEQDKEKIVEMNMKSIREQYKPHADLENDMVANAIIWSAYILSTLLEKKPVRTLDEVVSFAEMVLKEKNVGAESVR